MTGRGRGGPALPELGPWLGRLPEVVRRDTDPDHELDPVRLELVTAMFERAAAARDFLLAGDVDGARAGLDRAAWLEVWRRAVEQVAERTGAVIDARLELAARRSGAPRRCLLAARPDAEERAMLHARLDSAGAPLERELARGGDPTEWPAAVRRRAAALEESWDELERLAREAVSARSPAVAALEGWRPPTALWVGLAAVLGLVAGWLGLALGGWIPRPAWLDPLADRFWSLPWP